MKLLSVILLIGALHVSAAVRSQERVTMKYDKIRVEDALEQVRKNSSYELFFSMHEIEVDKIISLNLDDVMVVDALKKILGDKYKYNVVKNIIIIKPVTETSEQQQKTEIKGKVVDEKGKPMPGVTIQLEGVAMGTATDIDGNFKMELPVKKGVLIFSFVGFKTQKVAFVAGKDLKVKMEEERSNLDEVTVVAYGEVSKREMTGAVSVIKADDIKSVPSPSISNLLQGRVAGMDVTNTTGAPGGGGTQITIRGYNSLNVENGRNFSNPLWVIDGVPMYSFTSPVTGTNSLADLNPEMIESIQVLKDAASTALYGSRAANGVILVTTKKGRKEQKGTFSVNVSQTYSFLPEYPTVYGGKGERDYRLTAFRNYTKAYFDSDLNTWVYPQSPTEAYLNSRGKYDSYWGNGRAYNSNNGDQLQDSLNVFYNNSSDFFKHFYQKGKVTNANIQTYGGSDRTSYSIGLGYYDEEGIAIGTGYNRLNLMGNFSASPIDDLTIIFNNYISVSDRSRGVSSGGFSSGQSVEIVPGNPYEMSSLLPDSKDILGDALRTLQATEEKNVSYRLRSTFGLNYKWKDRLTLSNKTSIDFTQNNRNYFVPAPSTVNNESETVGEIARNVMFLNETVLNYKYSIDDIHNFDLMLGLSYQEDKEYYNGGSAKNGPSDMIHYATENGWPDYADRGSWIEVLKNYQSDFSEKKLFSYFGRINYNYNKKYLLSATVRRDGSSVFGDDVRWATFPSLGLGWNFAQEDFMQWADWLDFAKFRATYGMSGNTFSNPYLSYGILTGGQYVYRGNPTLYPEYDGGMYNPSLTWEETEQYDFGVDLNMFNYRMQITADYYYRYTDQMLYKVPVPGNYSAYKSMWQNAAAISNQGLELEIKYDIIRNKDSYWRCSFNIAKNWNMLESTFNGKDIYDPKTFKTYVIGKELNSIMGYSYAGLMQTPDDIQYYYNANGEKIPVSPGYGAEFHYAPGNIKPMDINGDYKLNYKDLVYLGSSLPKIYGGIVNEVKWKDFDLNMLLSYSLGRDMINVLKYGSLATRVPLQPLFINVDNYTFWEKPGDKADFPIIASDRYNDDFAFAQDRHVETVNYLKLKTLTLGYTLPKRILGKGEVRFFFSGENLFTLTNYSGADPETVDMRSGLDDGRNYPIARKLTLGLTIKL